MRVGPFVWWGGEAQPLAYKYVLLSFELIELPFSPFYHLLDALAPTPILAVASSSRW
jgi:hypothetical protein